MQIKQWKNKQLNETKTQLRLECGYGYVITVLKNIWLKPLHFRLTDEWALNLLQSTLTVQGHRFSMNDRMSKGSPNYFLW